MKNPFPRVKIGLYALALTVGTSALAAEQPIIRNISRVPWLTIESKVGYTNQIQYTNKLTGNHWAVLTNLVVTQSPYWFFDVSAASEPQRYYQVVNIAPTNEPPPPPAPAAGMVAIPEGVFLMGVPGSTAGVALEHSVFVNAFLMDSNLVSYTLWANVYQWAISHGYSFSHAGAGKAATHPVQKVDWYDVVKWCNARSEKDGLTPCYYVSTSLNAADVYRTGVYNLGNGHVNWAANGYRLPTEAEWERAARGGTNGRLFPWATDKISKTRANYFGNTASYSYDEGPDGFHSSYKTGNEPYTSPVGDLKSGRNAYGLYDMAGNVGQWCWDWYGRSYYTTINNPVDNPQGPNTGTARVVRSGSWQALAPAQKCSARDNRTPKTALNTIGFRCVRGLDY